MKLIKDIMNLETFRTKTVYTNCWLAFDHFNDGTIAIHIVSLSLTNSYIVEYS